MLVIDNVTKIFNRGTVNAKTALDGLSLTINEGDFITVIGGNGAGKSTLMNALTGVFRVDEGSILLDGIDIGHMPEHKRAKFFGRVFQDPMMGTAADMQIDENMALALRKGTPRGLKWGVSQKERDEYRALLSELDLGLENRLSSKVGLLSGGQRQAITLLMATLRAPKILLLDEHTAALDPKTAAKVLEITDRIVNESKLTTLMITHNMKDAIEHGNRLIMLHAGKVIIDVSGEEKKKLTVEQLLSMFSKASGNEFSSDRAMLS